MPLTHERLDRLRSDCVADEALRYRADENLARLRGLLESGSDVHGVAGGERLARTRDDLAGVDADAHLEPEGCDRVAHLDRSSYRAQRVVLVNLR